MISPEHVSRKQSYLYTCEMFTVTTTWFLDKKYFIRPSNLTIVISLMATDNCFAHRLVYWLYKAFTLKIFK